MRRPQLLLLLAPVFESIDLQRFFRTMFRVGYLARRDSTVRS
jgi:hypothetical protein